MPRPSNFAILMAKVRKKTIAIQLKSYFSQFLTVRPLTVTLPRSQAILHGFCGMP